MKQYTNIKTLSIVIILILTSLFTVSCKKKDTGGWGSSKSNNANTKNKKLGELIVEDEERLVTVNIKDGKARVQLNLDTWDNLFNFSDLVKERDPEIKIANTSFSIIDTNGPIKDAMIARVETMYDFAFSEFITPTIFLLMEDGTVEYTMAFPRMYYDETGEGYKEDTNFYTFGKLPWIKDIVSFSHETDSEGIGDKVVYGIDSKGLHYNLQIPMSYQNIFDINWETRLFPDDYEFENYMMFLNLEEDGSAVLKVGFKDSGADSIYKGTYNISLDDENSKGRRPGIFEFDLKLDYTIWDNEPETIKGTYFGEAHGLFFDLWLSDGDRLFPEIDQYNFFVGFDEEYDTHNNDYYNYNNGGYGYDGINVWAMSEEILFEYLMSQVPSVLENVMMGGMALMDFGDSVDLDGFTCRAIWLGTNHPEHFVREIMYAISDNGTVYEYDVLTDLWYIM